MQSKADLFVHLKTTTIKFSLSQRSEATKGIVVRFNGLLNLIYTIRVNQLRCCLSARVFGERLLYTTLFGETRCLPVCNARAIVGINPRNIQDNEACFWGTFAVTLRR